MHLFWVTVTTFFQKRLVGSLGRHEQGKPQQNTVAARSEVVAWHTADSRLILKAVIGHPSPKRDRLKEGENSKRFGKNH